MLLNPLFAAAESPCARNTATLAKTTRKKDVILQRHIEWRIL
jgi:hypothetical protein